MDSLTQLFALHAPFCCQIGFDSHKNSKIFCNKSTPAVTIIIESKDFGC
jgi:hypothetical protein